MCTQLRAYVRVHARVRTIKPSSSWALLLPWVCVCKVKKNPSSRRRMRWKWHVREWYACVRMCACLCACVCIFCTLHASVRSLYIYYDYIFMIFVWYVQTSCACGGQMCFKVLHQCRSGFCYVLCMFKQRGKSILSAAAECVRNDDCADWALELAQRLFGHMQCVSTTHNINWFERLRRKHKWNYSIYTYTV